MTEAATKFVAPLTFEALSGNPVLLNIFPEIGGVGTVHIDWARWPNLIIVCPATANTIAKVAHGFADNALTTILQASTAPVIFCPAMNKEMYGNRLYQENQQKLMDLDYHFVAPGIGELACGETGWGRLADMENIVDEAKRVLLGKNDLQEKHILVTAGPTYEPLDPVRYLGNRSSGKMGYAIAERAALRGAIVTLISGPSTERPFSGIQYVPVKTAAEMAKAVATRLPMQDVLIMSAAVADYRPAHVSAHKLKKADITMTLQLERTQDILVACSKHKGDRVHIGFSVETENELEASLKKLNDKNLDLVVINNPLESGAGFEVETNIVTLLDKRGGQEKLPLMTKTDLADKILDKILDLKRVMPTL